MGEVNFLLRLDFGDIESSHSIAEKLREFSDKHDGDLETVLRCLLGDIDEFGGDINIEDIEHDENSIYISAYGSRSSRPSPSLAIKFHELGCPHSYIRSSYDEGSESIYFLGAKRVSFDQFASATQSTEYKEIEDSLYLPTGRVRVRATLIEFNRDEGDFGEFYLMKFQTDEGVEFYYKENSKQLVLLTQDEYESECTFTASFEKGYLSLKGPPYSFAKRPSKIEVNKIKASSAADSLTGESKKYLQEPIAPLILRYFEVHNCDSLAFLKSITKDSLTDIRFSELMSMADESSSEQFYAFSLYLCAQTRLKRQLLIQCEYGSKRSNQDDLLEYLHGQGINFISEWKHERNFSYAWISEDVFVETKIAKDGASLEICRRLPVCADGKTVQRQYGEFLSNPDLPSKADWLDLYDIVENKAQSGDHSAMLVFADLLDSGHEWEKQPKEASKWRQLGEQNN
jgi:hypothetical protein